MDRFAKFIFVVAVAASCAQESQAMSMEQLRKTANSMKNSCMSKNHVTEDMVGSIEKGVFPEDKNVMCYVACVYRMFGVIKNGRMDYEASLKVVDLMFPQDLKAPTKQVMTTCKDVGRQYDDVCEAAYRVAQCMQRADPASFFFP